MKLTNEEVAQIAFLSRLKLSGDETEKLGEQLNKLLVNFETLGQLDTENVEPTSHTIPVRNVLREDVSKPSLTPDEVLANAPKRRDDTFVVPRIVET